MDDLPRWRNLSALGRALVPFCVGCLIAGISGCRTATAVPVNTVADYRESYPEQAFYVYRAISRVSPLDAEQTAKAAVAAQVSSTLQASLVSMKASTCAQQECRTIHEAIQTISSQTTFDKAEMIRIDGRLSSTAVGEYVAVAYLSRQELAASVGQEFEEIAASFLPATTRILNASSVVDFSAGYRAARELMVQLTGTAVRYESVVGIPVKGWGEARQLWQLVMERRTEWLAELKVQITVDAKAAVRARIQSAFTTAFSDLGVVVESAGPCTDSYTLAVIP